jgi:GNAT superfamily N-acetyltransferase
MGGVSQSCFRPLAHSSLARSAWAMRIRPLQPEDRPAVLLQLGPVLTASYPQGQAWLVRRLEDVLRGEAYCHVVRDRVGLAGLTIEIWVAERRRGHGLGAALIANCQRRWITSGVEEAWVTAASPVQPALERTLVPLGFHFATKEANRYGLGRDELVYRWETEAAATQASSLRCTGWLGALSPAWAV